MDDMIMEAKIAVATVLGKAYYFLVNELKVRGIPFLSLTPYEDVPLRIEVVITTENERTYIKHSKVLIYKEKADPSGIVDEAIRLMTGKEVFEALVVGVDPGKTFGIAVLNDGNILKTFACSSVEESVSKIIEIFNEQSAAVRFLKVGDEASSYTAELLPLLDTALPEDVIIEIVREAGTSRFIGQHTHKRRLKHAMAAIKIAERRGQPFTRKEHRKSIEASS
jgi:hypothetical protein